MNRTELIQNIQENITDNDNGLITAQVMRDVLGNIVNEDLASGLGNAADMPISQKAVTDLYNQGYRYVGTATPSTTPMEITAEDRVFYIAVEAGDYPNFGQLGITELTIFKSVEGRWVKEELGMGLYDESNRFIWQITDNNNNTLLGITKNGEVYWKIGIPTHIKQLINSKVDKEIGFALISQKVKDSIRFVDNNYIHLQTDSNGKVLSYTLKNGDKVYNTRQIFNDDVTIAYSLKLSPQASKDICVYLGRITEFMAKYPYAQYLPKIAKLKRAYDDYNPGRATTPPLVIAHFSDLHGDKNCAENIYEFISLYKRYIDDTYLTGDIVQNQFPDDFSFLDEGKYQFLLAIGNHDAWKENKVPVEIVSEKEVYDKFFKPYIANWNVVQPSDAESGKCYYYKDYKDSMIRIITVNCMHDTQDQLDFVTNALSDAKTKNYSVVVMSHYTADYTQGIDVTFDSIDYELLGGDYGTFNPKVANVLETFIDDGGKFIAWIGGHWHIDMFGYMLNHPRLLQINIEAASGNANSLDSVREGSDKEAFNIISFDTAMGFIKILRIGDNTDRHLRSKNVLVYDYINKNIINNY